jgi:hypothetical protein
VDDRARIADDLALDPMPVRGGLEELCDLVLLQDRGRLLLGLALGVGVALERQQDDEPERDREARAENAEHARGPVAVAEVAAAGGHPAQQQHQRHHRGHRCDEDRGGEEQVHGAGTVPGAAAASGAGPS